jgi:hypothetical protein
VCLSSIKQYLLGPISQLVNSALVIGVLASIAWLLHFSLYLKASSESEMTFSSAEGIQMPDMDNDQREPQHKDSSYD